MQHRLARERQLRHAVKTLARMKLVAHVFLSQEDTCRLAVVVRRLFRLTLVGENVTHLVHAYAVRMQVPALL